MIHYLDNAATTPVRQEAAQAAMEAMTQGWGNPSARYALGTAAANQLKGWRSDVASGLGCDAQELFFTSCGTESDNWAIQAAVELGKRKGKHIITTAIEHGAVLQPCKALEQQGYEITHLHPDREGNITISQLKEALRPDTVLVSMMLVNNELGTVMPVAQAAQAIREAGSPALLHCDAVQAFLKVPFTTKELGVDLLSISGHKIHGPKGIGALYINSRFLSKTPESQPHKIKALILGGGQESGLRSGTEPTAQIAALAAAVRAGKANLEGDLAHMQQLKEYAIQELTRHVPDLLVLTQGGAPHILPITLPGYKSESVVRFLSDRNVFVASGSACHKGKPSHVFAALKLPKPQLDGVLRISFSYDTGKEDVDALVQGLMQAKDQLFTALS